MRSAIDSLQHKPLLSIILPVYNVDEKWLRRCIESVTRQLYPHWELCIADDASTAVHVRIVLDEYAKKDRRIKVVFRPENGHISAASNSALELVSGAFTVLLDHDDELSEDALYWVAKELNENPDAIVIYSDEDLIDKVGHRSRPKFKPDFSRDLFYSFNLLTHLSAFETATVKRVGGFRIGFEGSQDYDLALRVTEQIREDQIRHIPRVLYHWRAIRGSVAFAMSEKPYAHERARLALSEHFQRSGIDAEVFESADQLHRVRYRIPDTKAKDHVVLAVRSGGIVDDLNRAVAESHGEVLVFVDDDLIEPEQGSFSELIPFALQPGIGAVGAKILNTTGVVEQCGIVLTTELFPAFAHLGFPRHASGDMSRNRQIGNYSAISMSCMAIRRELFERLGGFDASVPAELCDVDLCLRLRKLGLRIVTVPQVELRRRGDSKKPVRYSDAEMETFRKRWQEYVDRDPFCNPNLKRDGSFEIF